MATPKLRFKEFDGDWANLKYKDVLNIKYGKDHKSLSDGEIPVYGTGGIMRYVDKFLYEGESILIGRKGTINQPKYVNEKFWTVDTLFYTEIKENSVPLFLFQHALQVNWLGLNEATGVPSLNTTSINNVDISLPPKEEQTKIASFLSVVDEKISQLTQKYELLSQYKQGMMQKLFSQQIRFKADDGRDFGEWEEIALGKIKGVSIASGKSSYEKLESAKYYYYGSTGVIGYSNEYDYQGTKILIARVGHNAGYIYMVTGKYNVSDNTLILELPSNLNYIFIRAFLEKIQLNKLVFGTGQPLITGGLLKKVVIQVPCLEEQTKIANFLSVIDQKVENVAQQIEETKQWKKGLLQQMFV